MWRKGDVVINKYYPSYMVREGDPYLYDAENCLIPDPPGFHRTFAMSVTGVPHIGGLSPDNWYQVSVIWWYVRTALYRVQYLSMKYRKQASWYVQIALAMLQWMASYIPKVPKK